MAAREILIKLLGGKCEICGSTENLELHHKDRNPKNNDPSNIQLLCRKCHRRIHGWKQRPKKNYRFDRMVTFRVESSLLERARELGLNISKICREALKRAVEFSYKYEDGTRR